MNRRHEFGVEEDSITSSKSEFVFSAIQPTGSIHVGNYVGAISTWLRLSRKHPGLYAVADYHALTSVVSSDLSSKIWNCVAELLACGLGGRNSPVIVQSSIPEHAELCWLLTSVVNLGSLFRMTQYKDKSLGEGSEQICSGLLMYPVLQAADILLHRTTLVPVGEDQRQHIELCRLLARRFNLRYGEVFREPNIHVGVAKRILGLDGKRKMSKSLGNDIGLFQDKKTIFSKISKTTTDEQRVRRTDCGRPEMCNVFAMHEHFTSENMRLGIASDCRTAKIGCVDCKMVLSKNVWETATSLNEKKKELLVHPKKMKEKVKDWGVYYRNKAIQYMKEIKSVMGLPIVE